MIPRRATTPPGGATPPPPSDPVEPHRSHSTLTLTGARPPVHPRARPVLLDLALRAAPLRQAHRDAARPPLRPHLLLQGPLPLRSDTHVARGCSLGCARLQPGVHTRLQPGRQRRHRGATFCKGRRPAGASAGQSTRVPSLAAARAATVKYVGRLGLGCGHHSTHRCERGQHVMLLGLGCAHGTHRSTRPPPAPADGIGVPPRCPYRPTARRRRGHPRADGRYPYPYPYPYP